MPSLQLNYNSKTFKVGQKIWCVPLSNNVSRYGRIPLIDQIKATVITKVGSSNLTTDTLGTFNFNGHLDRGNYGYLPFASEEDARDYVNFQNEDFKAYFINFTFEDYRAFKEFIANRNIKKGY